MSPAAVDVRSPIASSQPMQSSALRNPSSMAESQFNFGAFSSGFGDAREGGDDSSIADFGRSGPPAAAAPPKRSRPRFVKVRKQLGSQHARSRTGSSDVGSGFNPFCSSNGVPFLSGGNEGVGFVFGANRSGVSENLDPREVKSSSDETGKWKIEKGTESMKNENLGFVFRANGNSLESNLGGEKEQSVSNAKEVVSDDKGNTKTESESEFGKFGAGFAFSCNRSGLASTSNLEKTECGKFLKTSSSDFSEKVKLETQECSKHGNVAFVLGASQNDHKTEDMKSSCSDFVSGSSWFNSESNLSSEKRDSFVNRVPDRRKEGECETEFQFQKVEAAPKVDTNDSGVFIFGSKNRTGSSLNERTAADFGHEVQLNTVNVSNCSSTIETQGNNLGSDVSVKCKYIHESRDNIANVSSTSSVHKLPDEMRKLNIDDSENVSGAQKAEISNTKPGFNAETAPASRRYIKVSRGYNKVSNCSSRYVETNPCDKSSKGPIVDVDITSGNSTAHSEQRHVVFGSGNNTSYASGISSSEPFIFQAGVGESADNGKFHKSREIDDNEVNIASSKSSFLSSKPKLQPKTAFVGVKGKDTKSFPSNPDGLGVSTMGFRTPICDASSLKESLFPKLNKKLESSVKNKLIKDKGLREAKRKLKEPLVEQWHGQDHASKESSSQEKINSPGCYSPMDFSPYQESTVTDQYSRETSAISDGSSHLDNNCRNCFSDAPVPSDLKTEDLVRAGKELDSDTGNQESKELNEENFGYHSERTFVQNCPLIFKAEFACSSAQFEQADGQSGAGLASAESVTDFSSAAEKQENTFRMQFDFTSGSEDVKEKTFLFSATSAGSEGLSARKHRHRRKSRIGVGHDSFVVTPSSDFNFGSPSVQSSSNAADKSEAAIQLKQGHSSSSAEIYEICEKWRLRGNQSYKNGDLSNAEEFYTQGIISVPSSERSGSCLKPLLLCYSNRAAARMCLLRIREAIGDCIMAAALDPNFLKAQMRAANCHLVLGEIENALQYFSKCLETGSGVCLDRRIILDAADGQQKAKKVAEHTDESVKLLEQKNPDAVLSALEIISEALQISLYSEKLLKMKAEALIMLRRHEEAIKLCEQSLSTAEKNFTNGLADTDGSAFSFVKLWRWCLISKSYFYLGKLEAALPLLDKLKEVGSIKDESASKDLESYASLAVTIRDLLQHKNAGNEAFKSGRYSEAVDHYTVAISSNVESCRFAAICFCNRAAAHQALGQISDAISDCSVAIALDKNYAKAVSRRATLHEMIGDYSQAASDLQRLISILENQSCHKAKENGSSGRSTASVKELRQAQMHLSKMEEEAKKGISLDFYLILGSKQSDTSPDIKKAYRKAALKHHPDKAAQFLSRSDGGDEGLLWKEISQQVNEDADRLFKMIGEAYTVLSDPAKRSQYDLEEELRKVTKVSNGGSTDRRHSDAYSSGSSTRRPDFYSSPFGRSSHKQNFKNNWKTYGNSNYSRW